MLRNDKGEPMCSKEYTEDCKGEIDEVYDNNGIYFGTLCEKHAKDSGIANWEFDHSYAGEYLDEEDAY